MFVTLTINVDSDADLTPNQLRIILGEMYQCCHNLESYRFNREVVVTCKPLKVNGMTIEMET